MWLLPMRRRRYEVAVTKREAARASHRLQHRRRGRQPCFYFPPTLQLLPNFAQWVIQEITKDEEAGVVIDPEVKETARGPLPLAIGYKSMYSHGNHFQILSVEGSFKTANSGVAATFKQVCQTGNNAFVGLHPDTDVEDVPTSAPLTGQTIIAHEELVGGRTRLVQLRRWRGWQGGRGTARATGLRDAMFDIAAVTKEDVKVALDAKQEVLPTTRKLNEVQMMSFMKSSTETRITTLCIQSLTWPKLLPEVTP